MAAALAPGVSRKLKKVLETRTDSSDLLASLGALSTFYVQNTPQARRNLKLSIEERALAINRHLLEASLPAHKVRRSIASGEVHALNDSWKKIEEALSIYSASTGDIISTTERLQQEIVSCFLWDYQLSNEDRAGLELMDMMSVYQEGAYERLCRWVQAECKKLGDTDNPEVSELLKKAVRCLKERPVLFKYCAEEVANMTHHAYSLEPYDLSHMVAVQPISTASLE